MSKELRDLYDQRRIAAEKANKIMAKEGVTEAEIKAVSNEIDIIDAKIQAQKKIDGDAVFDENGIEITNKSNSNVPTNMSIQSEILDDGGFENIGEFLHCVKNGDKKGRIQNLSTGDTGILIPPQFSQTILQLDDEDEIVMPRATNIPAGDPPDAPFSIPYLQQGEDGVLGGVELNWTGEAKTVKETKDSVIKDLTLTPQEVNGMATVNNKTLQNWAAAGTFIQTILRKAWINGRDLKFLKGSGAGCPLGVIDAPGAIEVTRTTENTFQYLDAVTMLSKLLPEALNGALWVVHVTLIPDVMTMKDEEGHLIFVQGDATKGIPPTLAGIPIKWTGKTSSKGKRGDVTLTNYEYYLTKAGSGPFVAISEHYKFNTSQTVFKITANIDGQPWVKDPLTLQDGETKVSPYIILK